MTSDLAAPVPYSPNVRIDASCLMCGTSGTRLERDHCHIHGWVRGTLCRSCNSLMGHFDAQVPPLKQSRWAACIAHRHRCHQCTQHPGDIPAGTLRSIERDLEPVLGKGWLR